MIKLQQAPKGARLPNISCVAVNQWGYEREGITHDVYQRNMVIVRRQCVEIVTQTISYWRVNNEKEISCYANGYNDGGINATNWLWQ